MSDERLEVIRDIQCGCRWEVKDDQSHLGCDEGIITAKTRIQRVKKGRIS